MSPVLQDENNEAHIVHIHEEGNVEDPSVKYDRGGVQEHFIRIMLKI